MNKLEYNYEIEIVNSLNFIIYIRGNNGILHQRYYKDEFIKKKYMYAYNFKEENPKVLECLSICRDELLDRGLLDEPE